MGNRHDMWTIHSNAFSLELECCQKNFNNLLYFSESKKMEQKFAEGCGTCDLNQLRVTISSEYSLSLQ
jgi:hypothetical protein